MTWQVSKICKTLVKWFLVWETSTEMLGNGLMVLKVCMVGMELAKEMLREERLFEFYDEKKLCVANTCFKKMKQRKITYSMGGNDTEIDFVLVGKNNRKYLKDVKAIRWGNKHRQKKVVKNEQTIRRRV